MTDYRLLCEQAAALCEGVSCRISNLANLSALLFGTLPDLNWAGFYLAEGKELLLGPFQGKTACTVIPFGKGVCGTSAEKDQVLVVDDVHAFPGHIACDGASRSEIVLPLHLDGAVFGVLDIDSPLLARFTEEDRLGLTTLIAVIEGMLAVSF